MSLNNFQSTMDRPDSVNLHNYKYLSNMQILHLSVAKKNKTLLNSGLSGYLILLQQILDWPSAAVCLGICVESFNPIPLRMAKTP